MYEASFLWLFLSFRLAKVPLLFLPLSLSVSHFCASAYAIKPDFNPVVVDIPSNYLNDFRLGGYALQVGKITRY